MTVTGIDYHNLHNLLSTVPTNPSYVNKIVDHDSVYAHLQQMPSLLLEIHSFSKPHSIINNHNTRLG